MGMGATDVAGRVNSSLGKGNPATPAFTASLDVPNAGVIVALPALLSNGLLRWSSEDFQIPSGYYGLPSIFMLLGFMSLARVKSIEALRYDPPGEWGKILGLDRVPEARTLRNKLHILWGEGNVSGWSSELCREWLQPTPESIGLFYIDGHVRVYHGSQTNLPRRYVSRQRLALRGTTDYWVNALDGQPVFVVTKTVDPGMVQVLKDEIVPCLLADAAPINNGLELSENPLAHRLTLVFDREGYSPLLFAELKKQRIACLTYRRKPGDDWPDDEFHPETVIMNNGEIVEMKLAERGVFLEHGGIWAREIRRLLDGGHQTPIIATDYTTPREKLAPAMFGRWCQENFFRYMMEQFGLDRIVTYQLDDIPDTTRIVNPAHRAVDAQIRNKTGQLNRHRVKFAAMNLDQPIESATVMRWEKKKAQLLQEIEHLSTEIDDLKLKRKEFPRHITAGDLAPDQRFQQLHSKSKHFIDTIKMIAYRAETAMANELRKVLPRRDDARSLLRAIYSDEADLIPDHDARILHVRLHHLANRSTDDAIRHLCSQMNGTETIFPQTNLRLVFDLGPTKNPGDQVV